MYLIGQLTLATALVLATTGLAVAQRVEVTPSVGYRWGGAITLQGDRANDKVDFDGAVSWGATVDVTLHDNIQAEFLYSRQEDTALTLFGRRGQVTDLGNAAIDVYHGGVVFVLLDPENRIRPFFVLTAGATSISPEEGDRVTRFAGGGRGRSEGVFHRQHRAARRAARLYGPFRSE